MIALLPHSSSRSQRWRERRSSFVDNDTLIDPSEFALDVIADGRVAKAFIAAHHYARTTPPTRLCVGLYRNGPAGRSVLSGVAAFTVPMNNEVVPLHTAMPPDQGVELGRFVLLDDVAANGETYFLARALRLLRALKPTIQAVVSFADPSPRYDADGNLSHRGHIGKIYAAASAAYRGQRPPRSLHVLPNGQPFSERAASKIRRRETGYAYAIDQLVAQGAPRPDNDDLAAWYAGLVRSGFLRTHRRPGTHAYAFPLTLKARLAGKGLPRLTPPRRDPHPGSRDVTALPLFAR
jgi:hypothetical protein